MLTKRKIKQETPVILNVYAPNRRVSKFIKETTKAKATCYLHILVIGNINTLLPTLHRLSRQNRNK